MIRVALDVLACVILGAGLAVLLIAAAAVATR
jgi:hypothetical protein